MKCITYYYGAPRAKIKYAKLKEAKVARTVLIRRTGGGHYDIYMCEYCNNYHIGSKRVGKALLLQSKVEAL